MRGRRSFAETPVAQPRAVRQRRPAPAVPHSRTLTAIAAVVGLVIVATLAGVPASGVHAQRTAPAFADRVRLLSEPSGSFDTDNLISNEMRYLEVIPTLTQAGVAGGAYVGVGPDQNFSYIARIRPSVAYIIDIRRDNLLLHLLFKALFAAAPTRIEYLSLLTGRAPPVRASRWRESPLDDILTWIDAAERSNRETVRNDVERRLRGFGVPLTTTDLETIARFHAEFIDKGLALQFTSHGRAPLSYYPTLRMLLRAADRTGQQWSYVATDDAYQFVRELQAKDAIVPIVGDLAGPRALRAIGTALKDDGVTLSAFYASNVEDYLFRRDKFVPFVDNLKTLPRRSGAVVIRSVFRRGTSVSMVQGMDDLLKGVLQGRLRVYGDVITSSRP